MPARRRKPEKPPPPLEMASEMDEVDDEDEKWNRIESTGMQVVVFGLLFAGFAMWLTRGILWGHAPIPRRGVELTWDVAEIEECEFVKDASAASGWTVARKNEACWAFLGPSNNTMCAPDSGLSSEVFHEVSFRPLRGESQRAGFTYGSKSSGWGFAPDGTFRPWPAVREVSGRCFWGEDVREKGEKFCPKLYGEGEGEDVRRFALYKTRSLEWDAPVWQSVNWTHSMACLLPTGAGEAVGGGHGCHLNGSEEVLANLWVGTGGGVTLPHYDAEPNGFLQVCGSKDFLVASAEDVEKEGLSSYIGAHPAWRQMVQPLAGGAAETGAEEAARLGAAGLADGYALGEMLSKLKSARQKRLVPGTWLYVPAYMWHTVAAKSTPSVSLNAWALAKGVGGNEDIAELALQARSPQPVPRRVVNSFASAVQDEQEDDMVSPEILVAVEAMLTRIMAYSALEVAFGKTHVDSTLVDIWGKRWLPLMQGATRTIASTLPATRQWASQTSHPHHSGRAPVIPHLVAQSLLQLAQSSADRAESQMTSSLLEDSSSFSGEDSSSFSGEDSGDSSPQKNDPSTINRDSSSLSGESSKIKTTKCPTTIAVRPIEGPDVTADDSTAKTVLFERTNTPTSRSCQKHFLSDRLLPTAASEWTLLLRSRRAHAIRSLLSSPSSDLEAYLDKIREIGTSLGEKLAQLPPGAKLEVAGDMLEHMATHLARASAPLRSQGARAILQEITSSLSSPTFSQFSETLASQTSFPSGSANSTLLALALHAAPDLQPMQDLAAVVLPQQGMPPPLYVPVANEQQDYLVQIRIAAANTEQLFPSPQDLIRTFRDVFLINH